MKIPYKKQRSTSALICTILFGSYSLYGIYAGADSTSAFITLIVSICYFIFFLFDKETYYFTLQNGNIKTRKIFGKIFSLSKIERIDETENKLVLKSKSSELQIDKKVIPSETLDMFKTELKKYNLV